jgi:hypothetical protein
MRPPGQTAAVLIAVMAAGWMLAGAVPAVAARALPAPQGNFSRSGVVVDAGRAVEVSGPVTCAAGDAVKLRATISQPGGSVAVGVWSMTCTGRAQRWHGTAKVIDGVRLGRGLATGVGLAVVRQRGRAADAFQWLAGLSFTVRHSGQRASGGPAVSTTPVQGGFFPTGKISRTGKSVRVSGPVRCSASDTVFIAATVSQHSGGVAAGSWSRNCAGRKQRWHTIATVTDGTRLTAGCAHGTGLAIVRRYGKPAAALQWISLVTLTGGHSPAGHPATVC